MKLSAVAKPCLCINNVELVLLDNNKLKLLSGCILKVTFKYKFWWINIVFKGVGLISEKEDKYSKILDSAVKVFADFGVDNSTVSRIASAAGVADGTIYLYFKNKDDILIQFAKTRGENIFSDFEKVVANGRNAREKLYNLFLRHLTVFSENRDLAVVFQAEISKLHSAEPRLKELSKRYRRLLQNILDTGIEEGSISKETDTFFLKDAIAGAVNETINVSILDRTKIDVNETAHKLIKIVFQGIGS